MKKIVMMMAVIMLGCVSVSSVWADTIYVNGSAGGANTGDSWGDAYTDIQTTLGSAVINLINGWEGYFSGGHRGGTMEYELVQIENGNLRLQSAGATWCPPVNEGWEGPFNDRWDYGPFIYINVTGDFVATTKVAKFADTPQTPRLFNTGGIMARVAGGELVNREDFIEIASFATCTGHIAWNCDDNNREEDGQTRHGSFELANSYSYLQIERIGSTFYWRISANGIDWIPLVSTDSWAASFYSGIETPMIRERPDLPEQLQLGLFQCTVSRSLGFMDFDYFEVTDSNGTVIFRDDFDQDHTYTSPSPQRTIWDITQWKESDGGNGHYYMPVSGIVNFGGNNSTEITRQMASEISDLTNGYLATITSDAENEFVFGLVNYSLFWNETEGPWLGGYQLEGAIEPYEGWNWVTGESFEYTNWSTVSSNDNQITNEGHMNFGGSNRTSAWSNHSQESLPVISCIIEFDSPPVLPSPVLFNDPNLKADVESKIYNHDVTPLDMLSLTALNASNNNIVDLTGIEWATNLTYLDLRSNSVTNIAPLTSLRHLDNLYLSDNALNQFAYCAHIPLIKNINSNINITFDTNPTPSAGDCNGDCRVNLPDLALMASNWLKVDCGICNGADQTGDGSVLTDDLAVVAENWLNRNFFKFYENNLDNNPNWVTEGQWEFGQPSGSGGDSYGNPDPDNGFTGSSVYGVNLNGDYDTISGGPHSLTAGPFDCTYLDNVKLKFARWLNADESAYVNSFVEGSNDGETWELIWEYNDRSALTDNAWQVVEYDISSIADGQETVYIRWGYEVLDYAYPYSGWNIDDVELWGNP